MAFLTLEDLVGSVEVVACKQFFVGTDIAVSGKLLHGLGILDIDDYAVLTCGTPPPSPFL